MKSTLNALIFSALGLCLSFCSSAPKEETQETPEQYSSSGVYNDIQGASSDDDRALSSSEYSDDEYGTVETAGSSEDEELFLSDTEGYQDSENEEEPASIGQAAAGSEPLPSYDEPAAEPEAYTPPVTKRTNSSFKNGMYRFSKKCHMRTRPSKKGRAVGKVKTGRKLWVEGHNSKWVKVFKKSGEVYVHKSCL